MLTHLRCFVVARRRGTGCQRSGVYIRHTHMHDLPVSTAAPARPGVFFAAAVNFFLGDENCDTSAKVKVCNVGGRMQHGQDSLRNEPVAPKSTWEFGFIDRLVGCARKSIRLTQERIQIWQYGRCCCVCRPAGCLHGRYMHACNVRVEYTHMRALAHKGKNSRFGWGTILLAGCRILNVLLLDYNCYILRIMSYISYFFCNKILKQYFKKH